MAGRNLAAAIAAGLLMCVPPAGQVRADDGSGTVVVTPTNPYGRNGPPGVGVGVSTAARQGRDGPAVRAATVNGSAPTSPPCRYVADPDMEWIERSRGTPTVGQATAGAHLYARVCGGLLDGWAWVDPGARSATGGPTPAELAREAYRELVLPAPVVGMSRRCGCRSWCGCRCGCG